MDPNATLAMVRRLVGDIGRMLDHDQTPDMATVNDLCEAVDGLDQWLATGGFLPDAWASQPVPTMGPVVPRYICKTCGAESPTGIGYALAPGAEPPRAAPLPDCPNLHLG